MLCEDVIVIGSGAAEKMTWLDAYNRSVLMALQGFIEAGRN